MEQSSSNPKPLGDTSRIYVVHLADHNSGRLHGRRIDAGKPADAIREQIAEVLVEPKEPIAKEWAIRDYEGYGDLRLSGSEDIEQVAEVAFLIAECGLVFASLLGYLCGTSAVDEARRYMEEGYRGQ